MYSICALGFCSLHIKLVYDKNLAILYKLDNQSMSESCVKADCIRRAAIYFGSKAVGDWMQ